MKIHRKPKDETKDHLNFLQHQAGLDSTLEIDTNHSGQTYDSRVESWYGDGWRVSKPAGRQPFNANLLTIAQVKFHPKEIAQRVVKKLRRIMSERNPIASAGYNVTAFDTIFNILDNRRCAKLASLHFNRPKIWKEHLKEIESQEALRAGTRSVFSLQLATDKGESKKYDLTWGWFRKYLYGMCTLREIRDPVIESLCRRHKDLIASLRETTNATATLLGALDMAVEFQLHEQGKLDDQPAGKVTTNTTLAQDNNGVVVKNGDFVEDKTVEDIDDVVDEIIEEVKQAVVDDTKESTQTERAAAGIDDAPDNFESLVEDNLKNQEKLNQAKKAMKSDKCTAVLYDTGDTVPFTPTVPIQSLELEGALDRGANTLGHSGHRVSRRAWRLPLLGDSRVFHKYPQTATEMVMLVDMSASMGNHGYKWSRMHGAMNVVSAVQARFPDTKAYGFTASRDYADELGHHSVLIPITKGTVPNVKQVATPLCGAMKKLSKIVDLESSKVLVITDGAPNVCEAKDPVACCRRQSEDWLRQGVRFATLYIGHRNGKHPLPADLAVEVEESEYLSTTDIVNVLSFFKG